MNSGDAGALARYQAARRAILAIIIVLAFTMLVFGGSLHDELMHEYIETLGLALVMVGIGGRLWATLYIGGRKSAVVVSTGPYSITRNPLYLFSSIAAAGVGAQTGSYVVTCLCLVLSAAFFHIVARREERFLSTTLGDEYFSYLRRVPRFLPNPLIYRDDAEVTFKTERVRATFVDGLVFLAAIAVLEAIEVAQEAGTVPILFWLF
ncbi:isoprenylcysteine carboxylmethyltransferase family protein [Chelativorans sp. M5D2P16]|uniref:methyltransferase family protein n=1 Tax=Chelativorans sp. M5D2P16 TaxID=3095678 RepID=UPI002ACB0225|nr:isoprenylcysteine carboxylmethyltransferase family protein [Chelativorans sp. M5D2P16]MDZ5698484.1 isoprenylcysteine carboxylmethyltransferase family protein [Chelativorans sp. M5D2P16]MDZ5698755.1 isoprenylcysteine carboxylmethyltransferase family protein [Chelativorans sp. M5D2P16]